MYWQRGRLIFGAELGSREKLVLLAISDHLGSNDTAWPSHARLARRCGMNRRTIVRAMEWLETHEVLTVKRVVGQSSRCSISIDWLKAHQCQNVTSDTESHVTQSHTPCDTESHPPVSESHTPCDTESHKGDQEGNQKKEVKKATKTKPARKTKTKSVKLTLAQVKAIPIPDGLPADYPAAFERWIDVRSGDHWNKQASQTTAFHAKMLRAHQQRKDIMGALERAHELGWSGIKAGWLDDLPIQVAIDPAKPRRHTKTRAELLADYQRTLEIS
jgi:hypothetical protein